MTPGKSSHILGRGILLTLLFALLLPLCCLSQSIDSVWFKLVQNAETYQFKKSYDTAIAYAVQAIDIAQKKHYEQDHWYSYTFLIAGDCYEKKKDPNKAHEYYNNGLTNARKYQHTDEKRQAYVALNNLQKLVVNNDWKFKYTPPTAVVEADVYYPIEKVEVFKDSIIITVLGGKLDGISDSSLAGGVYTRKSTNKEAKKREGGYFTGPATILKVGDNRTILKMYRYNDTLPVVSDLAKINSSIPLSWNNLPYKSSLINNVVWTDNSRQRILDRRYLYYFIDLFTTKDIEDAMKATVEEVLPIIADDSAQGKAYGDMFDDGLFKYLKLYKSLEVSGQRYFNFFQNYALDNADNYRGNDYKFSEVYATWVVNKAPMLPNDIKNFLISLKTARQTQAFVTYLNNQISKDKLTDKWFDEGMQLAYQDDVKQARALARLLYDYGIGNEQPSEKGWACYLEAVCLKKLNNPKLIDSLLNVSAKYFQLSNNKEGLLWVGQAKQTFFVQPKVSFAVQSGHLMPFHIAMSPNSRYFATGSDDHLIKIWDINTAREVRTIEGHSKDVNDVVYSPGGRYLASCSDDSSIKIWNGFTYDLLQTIKLDKPDGKIIFSPDSKKVVSIGSGDSSIRVWDIFNGTLLYTFKKHKARLSAITFLPTTQNLLVSAGRDSMLYYWNVDSGSYQGYIKTKGKIVRAEFSNNGKFMYTTFTDSTLTLWKTDNYSRLFSTKVQSGVVLGTTFLSQPFFTPDSKYIIYVDTGGHRIIEELETLFYRTLNLLSSGDFIQEQYLDKDGAYLIEKSGKDNMIRILDFSTYSYQKGFESVNYTEIKQYQNPVIAVQFSQNDSSLYVLGMDLSKINFSNGTTTHITTANFPYYPRKIVMQNESITAQTTFAKTDTLKIVDNDTKKLLEWFVPDDGGKVRVFDFTPDEETCFIGSDKGTIWGWNRKQNSVLFKENVSNGEDLTIRRMIYDSIYKRLFVIRGDSAVLVLNATTGVITDSIPNLITQFLEFSPVSIFISNERTVNVYDRKTLKYLKELSLKEGESDFGCMAYCPLDNRLVVAASNASIYVADAETGKVLYRKKDSRYQVSSIKFNRDYSLMAVASFDNKVSLYNFKTGDLLLTIHTPLNSDFVISDTAGNYLASKKSLNGVVFNYNDGAYDFEQFDLQYNRPDLILKRTGRADTALVQSYYLAYKKRLKKAGLTEADMSSTFNLPVIRIPDKSKIRPVTSSSEYAFRVECYEPKTKLQSIHVLVNNTPVFGLKGYELAALDTFQISRQLTVPLSIGNNSIKIYCVNDRGISSLKESFDVYSNYKPLKKPITYFIGIAVANYKDNNFNLRYSAKDVRDLAHSFKAIYPDAVIDTLIDKNATKENILALHEKLLKTTCNDKIVMAVTGHGLLSDSLDFYYATYNVDFAKPAVNGLKYDDLENLLTDIPARQKLLMIDACHSGALDRETLLESKQISITSAGKDSGKVTATSRSSIRIKPVKVNLNNTFELMQNLFADLSTSNGTIVISAAGGLEYAFESPEWNNGVFTYCVRKGLEEGLADKEGGNYDGSVSVQELQQYVSRKVSELTNGKQKPTSRRENLDNDWSLK